MLKRSITNSSSKRACTLHSVTTNRLCWRMKRGMREYVSPSCCCMQLSSSPDETPASSVLSHHFWCHCSCFLLPSGNDVLGPAKRTAIWGQNPGKEQQLIMRWGENEFLWVRAFFLPGVVHFGCTSQNIIFFYIEGGEKVAICNTLS